MENEGNERLSRFINEAKDMGYNGLLPCYLSDEWLELLTEQATGMIEGTADDTTELIAAITLLLQSRDPNNLKVRFSESEMFNYIQIYRMEMVLEKFHRREGMDYNPATLDTILTERDMEVWGAIPMEMQAIIERCQTGPTH